MVYDLSDSEKKDERKDGELITIGFSQDVDIIAFSPVTETGWEAVLRDAKEADIPVILLDRTIDVKDKTLYTCWIGSDFEKE